MLNGVFVRILEKLFIVLIRFYQICISPLFIPSCRFYPSCSEYAILSIRRHGPFRGILEGMKRLLRCHPFHPGGYDPVK